LPSEAWIELVVEQGIGPGRLDDDGHMDFFERGLLKAVEPGQVVALLHPVVLEQAEGAAPQAPPSARETAAALKLALGSGVSLDADGTVRAARAGVVQYRAGKLLDVVDRHVHRGPVDLRTGNLDMPGSLTVQGDVERLFQVRATGDVEVLGSVSGGSVSAGGAVRISGAARGGDAARIVAGTDATLRSCEQADVTACGTLRVRDSVSSRLCAERVLVSGRMRGGSAVAEAWVRVAEAGTETGLATRLEAGEPCEPPALERVQRAVVMQKLRRMAERGGVREAVGSRGEARGKGGKLGRVDAASAAQQIAERAARVAERRRLQALACLEVGLAHAGVELCIGDSRLVLEHGVRDLRYTRDAETGTLQASRSSK
jgi:uncharacterized protein (DUF342 family)